MNPKSSTPPRWKYHLISIFVCNLQCISLNSIKNRSSYLWFLYSCHMKRAYLQMFYCIGFIPEYYIVLIFYIQIINSNFFQEGPSNMEMDTSRTSMIIFPSSNGESGSESLKRYYCSRQLLRITECMNTSVLDCALTFRCDKNISIYGIEVSLFFF